jgi:hypothetical protein
MVRCGVNLVGFDQLQPNDGRLAAFVWSWAQGEPSSTDGPCAFQGADTRFHASSCVVQRHFACADPSGAFHVTVATGSWSDGFAACPAEFPGSRYSVPPNGLRNARLAAEDMGSVWLDYARDAGGQWQAGAPASFPSPTPPGEPGNGHRHHRKHPHPHD